MFVFFIYSFFNTYNIISGNVLKWNEPKMFLMKKKTLIKMNEINKSACLELLHLNLFKVFLRCKKGRWNITLASLAMTRLIFPLLQVKGITLTLLCLILLHVYNCFLFVCLFYSCVVFNQNVCNSSGACFRKLTELVNPEMRGRDFGFTKPDQADSESVTWAT